MKHNFKVGQLYKVNDKLHSERGNIIEIINVDKFLDRVQYKTVISKTGSPIKSGFDFNSYFANTLEPFRFEKILITTDGTTTAKLFDGKDVVKTATAKCNPDDEFDFKTGATIAFDRLVKREPEKPKFTKEDLKTGMFVRMSDKTFGIIAGDKIVYENGGYDLLSVMCDDLTYMLYEVDAVINAVSFSDARRMIEINCKTHIIWRRGAK